MSILVLLSEVDFLCVPGAVRVQIEQFARSLPTTHMNEDAFHVLKERARQSPNHQAAPQTQWHALQTSMLAPDYDRPSPKVTEAARKSAPSKIPKELFESDAVSFTLGQDALPSICEGYTSPSPARVAMIPMCLQCCLAHSWAEVKKAWLSLLMIVVCVVVRKDESKNPFLVLLVTKFGCIVWELDNLRTPAGTRRFVLKRPCASRVPWQFVACHDVAEWKMAEAKLVPPCLEASEDRSRGILVDIKQRPEGMLQVAARRCFQNLLVPHLKQLVSSAGCSFAACEKVPTTEGGLCKKLTTTLLPESSQDDVAAILASRLSAKKWSRYCSRTTIYPQSRIAWTASTR